MANNLPIEQKILITSQLAEGSSIRSSCQLGRLSEARMWLKKALDLAGKSDLRERALEDPDLETLWLEISEI